VGAAATSPGRASSTALCRQQRHRHIQVSRRIARRLIAPRHHARHDGLEQRVELGLGGDRAVGGREGDGDQAGDVGVDRCSQAGVAAGDPLAPGAVGGGQGARGGMGQVPLVVDSGGNTWTQPILSWY
jgi:hypothetical protein